MYTKQKIEVLRQHKNFCGLFKFSNFQIWLNYLDRLILLDFHNILQDTFVGIISTPYKKLRSSGRTKTFAAHSKFQIWLNYLDRWILLDFYNILQDTSICATSTPYKKLRSSVRTKTFAAHSKFQICRGVYYSAKSFFLPPPPFRNHFFSHINFYFPISFVIVHSLSFIFFLILLSESFFLPPRGGGQTEKYTPLAG